MWRSKKLILIALLAVVVLAGSIGGVVLAADDEDETEARVRFGEHFDRVCEIYNAANPEAPIDCEALQDAFTQAHDELRAEARERMAEAREAFQQKLLEEGKITQEQLDQWEEWLNSKPDIPLPFGPEDGGGMRKFGGHRGIGGGPRG